MLPVLLLVLLHLPLLLRQLLLLLLLFLLLLLLLLMFLLLLLLHHHLLLQLLLPGHHLAPPQRRAQQTQRLPRTCDGLLGDRQRVTLYAEKVGTSWRQKKKSPKIWGEGHHVCVCVGDAPVGLSSSALRWPVSDSSTFSIIASWQSYAS